MLIIHCEIKIERLEVHMHRHIDIHKQQAFNHKTRSTKCRDTGTLQAVQRALSFVLQPRASGFALGT